MSTVTVTKDRYTVESLYQWDKNQQLIIEGISLSGLSEVHFTNCDMGRAIVKPCLIDRYGKITVDIPNSLLQKPYKITAYICTYTNETFETVYAIEIPVIARAKPMDYTLEDDEEVYSFNALETLVNNAVNTMTQNDDDIRQGLSELTPTLFELDFDGSALTLSFRNGQTAAQLFNLLENEKPVIVRYLSPVGYVNLSVVSKLSTSYSFEAHSGLQIMSFPFTKSGFGTGTSYVLTPMIDE